MIAEGTLVYLQDGRGGRIWLTLNKGMLKIAGLGVVDGDKLLSLEDGASVKVAGKDFHLLIPSAAEMMSSVERGAQVIIPKDAATILFELNVKSGDMVMEAGVGSGAMTIALLNSVRPWGKVISMEIREEFAAKARKNVERTGMQENWRLVIGDVRKDPLDILVDAVVLDMPDPWDAVENVESILRNGGRLCIYVPNANQLETAVKKIRASGFIGVKAMEIIQREMVVHEMGVRPSYETLGHTGYLIFGRKVMRDGQ